MSRIVPLAAARLRAETKIRITLLGRVERLATELREHLMAEVQLDDISDLSIDDAIRTLLALVEHAPFKGDSKPEASEPKPAAE